ncbi:MAG: response regulator transcription factor [Campylobacterales bacterium]|nr:response regulator transcription factor [Campylobacterales bacterium]
MKILLLEDEALLRRNIVSYLRKKGFDVVEFEDGKTLLESVNLYDYDAFILDINVPNFNGFEILEFIKNNDPKMPVILMSAYTETKDVLNGFKLGCADYLKKPFGLEELEVRLTKALGQDESSIIKINDKYKYDLSSRELRANGEIVKLPKTPSRLFYILAKRKGGIVKTEEIMEYLYPDGSCAMGAVIGRIRDLRAFIDTDVVENIHGVGYRLNIDKSQKD